MKTFSAAQFRQYSRPLRRIARDIGIAGIIGCALMTTGLLAMLYLQFVAAPVTPVSSGVATVAAPTPEIQNSPLTPENEINAAVLRLFNAAEEHKLALLEGDYRLASSADSRYRTYTISRSACATTRALRWMHWSFDATRLPTKTCRSESNFRFLWGPREIPQS